MIYPLKPGMTLHHLTEPVLETARLRLRPWHQRDIAPHAAMLTDPGTARFITPDGQPIDPEIGWRYAALMAGHWGLYGFGMFVVEDKSSGEFLGRVGPWSPPRWPGLEIGWAIVPAARGKGFAVEAAAATIDWAFATFDVAEVVHCIDCENAPSQAVARKLGATRGEPIDLFRHPADKWVTTRADWRRPSG